MKWALKKINKKNQWNKELILWKDKVGKPLAKPKEGERSKLKSEMKKEHYTEYQWNSQDHQGIFWKLTLQ
jgi:hypothetical protein